jgi:hypothetical protein
MALQVKTAQKRQTDVARYQTLLRAIGHHQSEAGFPVLLTDPAFQSALSGYVADVQAIDAARITARDSDGQAQAARSKGSAVWTQGANALVGLYGAESATLADFGLEPKKPVTRKHKARAQAGAGGATGVPGASGAVSAASPPVPSSAPSAPGAANASPATPAPASGAGTATPAA